MTGRAAGSGWRLAVHGGAGLIARGDLNPAQEAAYRAGMTRSAEAGAAVLQAGGPALDAVEAAVRVLEDDPLFNAGRGAVFSADGRHELDAAIMDGRDLRAGSVAGVTSTSHPVSLARAVMERSDHVMLAGAGADAFARAQGLAAGDGGPDLFTERRWRALVRALESQGAPVPPRPAGAGAPGSELAHDEGKRGTVGAVARDRDGHVAAATSTGGMTAKRWGRIGDSPLIGAGTYASDASCAISATGAGEYFIRLTVARDVAALMEYRGLTLQAAMDQVIRGRLTDMGGDGGVIGVSAAGEIGWSFNTAGMYRARAAEGEALTVGIYGDEP